VLSTMPRISRQPRTVAGWRRRAPQIVVGLGLALFLLWTVLPIFYLGAMSVKPEHIILDPPSLAFRPTFERYQELLRWHELGAPVRNSLISATLGTLGALILGTMMALAFALLEFPAKGLLFFLAPLRKVSNA
jgi:ABC-type glycerol-3-phosphate transport system permease component